MTLSEGCLDRLARALNDTQYDVEDVLDDLRMRYKVEDVPDIVDQLERICDLFRCGICGMWRSVSLMSPGGGCDQCVGGIEDEDDVHQDREDFNEHGY